MLFLHLSSVRVIESATINTCINIFRESRSFANELQRRNYLYIFYNSQNTFQSPEGDCEERRDEKANLILDCSSQVELVFNASIRFRDPFFHFTRFSSMACIPFLFAN